MTPKSLGIPIRALVLALAIGVLGVATAQAEWEWQLGGQQLTDLGESETISGSGGPFSLSTVMMFVPVTVKCESMELTGSTITPGGKGKSTLKLSGGCQVVGQPSCTVKEPINLKASTEVFGSGTQLFNRYTPAEAGYFATIEISGCVFAGKHEVKGAFAGKFEPGEERVEEPLAFSPKISEEAGTNLSFAGVAATIEGAFAMAASGANVGQKAAPGPFETKPDGFVIFPGTKVGKNDTMTITHTILGNKNVKFGAVSIVGSAGVLTVSADTCSGKEFAPTKSCTITVKFAPAEAKKYFAAVSTPWETAEGVFYGFRMRSVEAVGN